MRGNVKVTVQPPTHTSTLPSLGTIPPTRRIPPELHCPLHFQYKIGYIYTWFYLAIEVIIMLCKYILSVAPERDIRSMRVVTTYSVFENSSKRTTVNKYNSNAIRLILEGQTPRASCRRLERGLIAHARKLKNGRATSVDSGTIQVNSIACQVDESTDILKKSRLNIKPCILCIRFLCHLKFLITTFFFHLSFWIRS